ncbi:hypothetical protein A0H81_11614 [Grifola frondosa]|uniref:Uncharacterized protein n=1 Tax=Grifola frondosa TaxID=5627 RepID=A0A1C7LVI3_GRIFR|nr:hypothetical protein A0H81_11614 [Grifola frondosa]
MPYAYARTPRLITAAVCLCLSPPSSALPWLLASFDKSPLPHARTSTSDSTRARLARAGRYGGGGSLPTNTRTRHQPPDPPTCFPALPSRRSFAPPRCFAPSAPPALDCARASSRPSSAVGVDVDASRAASRAGS